VSAGGVQGELDGLSSSMGSWPGRALAIVPWRC
jgi:hypothetical protein